ncbi:MAG: zinc ribbon domain-containing protein [Firmicutes bacterium]|nr:zinc ribbon domain-containing protein [Bacillota bacterium]
MPEYDFRCPQCGKRFTVRTSIAEREKVRCPACGSQPEQVFSALNFNVSAAPDGCTGCAQSGCQWARR